MISSPADQVATIIQEAEHFRNIRVKPAPADGPWTIGLATLKGNVRADNQDFAVAFRIRTCDVLIIADGMGGLPHGKEAAHMAVVSAAWLIIQTYGSVLRLHMPSPTKVAARAVTRAAHTLAVSGDKMNISSIQGGLRTTLIVIIASQHEVGYAYIGDGGAVIVSASGEIRHFLKPQKANQCLNVLTASLGPCVEGEPVVGVLPRRPGDFLIAGTDGIFDRIPDGFAKDVLRGAIANAGDLRRTSEQILDELASCKDAAGYVCDDNLTLGLICDGVAPKLTHGFWNPIEGVPDGPPSPTSVASPIA